MLLRTIFLLTLLAVLGETIVHGAASLAQAALAQRALDAARVAFVSGVRTAQTSIAQTLAANPQTSNFEAPAPIARAGARSKCRQRSRRRAPRPHRPLRRVLPTRVRSSCKATALLAKREPRL